MSMAEQSSSWLPAVPLILQVAEPELESSVQPSAVVPAGSGSARGTPRAVPGPPLERVMVKPSGSPASTVLWSADLKTFRPGFKHSMLSVPVASGALDAEAVAVLSYLVQSALEVAA